MGTLDGAREAMGKDEIDAWLWEKFTTKHLVDNGESWPRMVLFLTCQCMIFQVGRDQSISNLHVMTIMNL